MPRLQLTHEMELMGKLRGCCKTKVEQQPLFLLKSIRGGVFWGKDVEKLPVF